MKARRCVRCDVCGELFELPERHEGSIPTNIRFMIEDHSGVYKVANVVENSHGIKRDLDVCPDCMQATLNEYKDALSTPYED